MLTKPKLLMIGCGLVAGIVLGGCSGGDEPAPDASASATPQPTSTTPLETATPSATPEVSGDTAGGPNITPLGGKPATEEEKEYYRLQKQGEDLVLARDYEKAIPLLEQALKQKPNDLANSFYLLLAHGSLEVVPSKGSAAYPYAQKVVELSPKSTEANRARSYLVGAEFALPKDFKYGDRTMFTFGNFLYEPKTAYKLVADSPLHVDLNARIGKEGQAILWEAEIAPKLVSSTMINLPKGTEVIILADSHFYYSLTSWRKPLPPEPREFDDSIFEMNAVYVEVVSDGDNKGKKGWMINQADRFIDKPGDDPFGVWIPDRLQLLREAEAETAPRRRP